jgi:hypothetical protein
MRSSLMTRSFGGFSGLLAGAAAVLVFHTAAFAQQAEPAAKAEPATKTEAPAAAPKADAPKAETPKAETPKADAPKAESTPEADANAQPELPPEYGPPPGYHRGPQPPAPPPGYGSQGYQPYYGPPAYGPPYGPPAYPPPPPRYYRPRYYAHPARYYPEPLRFRPIFFGLGLGVGGVSIYPSDTMNYNDVSRAGLGYSLRFGFGVSPHWSIVLSADGAQASFDGTNVSNTAWTIGPQIYITDKLYARAGIGAATYEDDGCYAVDSYGYCTAAGTSDSGMAMSAAIGFEFMQSYHTALALEAAGTLSRFPNKDKVATIGVNFVLLVF